MPAFQDLEGNISTSMKKKEALVYKSAFLKPPHRIGPKLCITAGIANTDITKNKIFSALISQSAKKAPSPNKINFQILCMIWDWDKSRITSMIQQAITLGYHLKSWKKAWEILLKKAEKRDFVLVKLYQIINLLNCIGKILEKVIAEQLSQFCKAYSKLYPGQITTQKKQSAIDTVGMLIHKVQEK